MLCQLNYLKHWNNMMLPEFLHHIQSAINVLASPRDVCMCIKNVNNFQSPVEVSCFSCSQILFNVPQIQPQVIDNHIIVSSHLYNKLHFHHSSGVTFLHLKHSCVGLLHYISFPLVQLHHSSIMTIYATLHHTPKKCQKPSK